MKKEIEIPEGYEAKIEGNKVVIVPKESEDERIIMELKDFVRLNCGPGKDEYKTVEEWCYWLEKQKEQKPAEWSEEDQRMLERVINSQKHVIPVPGKKGLEDMTTREEEDTEAIKWLRELPSRIRPVQEWSEEDELNKETAIRFLNAYAYASDSFDENGEIKSHDLRSCVDWLKSLRPQPKQEWSEEDDYRIRWIISLLTTMREKGIDDRFGDSVPDDIPDMIAWLKSLRPQPHWKPTKTMLDALKWAKSEFHPDCVDTMDNLTYLYKELEQLYYDGN